jgi:glycosyltransferase involved in cell wall biosynthesis
MGFTPLVSCIVPIYNAEKYLDQGVKSLLAQTYENIEIILIDDCSSDSSWSICQKYSSEYSNILAFRNELNSGAPLRSRERGILESHGEWITFMDGDDYVLPSYVKNLVLATHSGKFDIAVTGYSRLYPNNKTSEFTWNNYQQTTPERLSNFYQHLLTHDFYTEPTDTVGQSLIRASVCKKTNLSKYSNLVYAEDTLMALAFLANSDNGVNFVDKHDFMWRQIEGSGSHGGFSERTNQTEFYVACLDIFHEPDIYSKISQLLPLISLIIPVYNVEKYLSECLDSVINQTYKNIEIIIVNDGSPDNSQKIIDSYGLNDHRVLSIKQSNKGLNEARASGVKVAKGEFITFVDSDDIIHKDYLKILYENILTNHVDISIAGYKNFYKKNEINTTYNIVANYSEQVLHDKISSIRYYLGEIQSVPNVYQMTAWGKLFKATIVKETDWNLSNYRRHEDNLESIQWYSMVTCGVSVISSQLYYYRANPDSITGTMKNNIGPDGEEMNYFEWLKVLYDKTTEYLHDDQFNLGATNQLAHTNSIQARNLFLRNKLETGSMMSVIDNWGFLIELYNKEIIKKDEHIKNQEATIRSMHKSISWRTTAPIRMIKKLLISVYKKLF